MKFIHLPKYPDDMTGEELRTAFVGAKDAEIVRGLILAEVEAIRGGAKREHRTMRNLWYTLVKPALSRAGVLNNKTRGGKPVAWAGKLSVYLSELVGMGLTSYEGLGIIDGSRQRQQAACITNPITDVEVVGPHFPWVILFTEKDTIWGEVESLASLYGVSAISGGGQPSNACTENMIRGIVRSEVYRRERPGTLVLLTLTDYDPAGYSIADAQYNQIVDAANAIGDEVGELREIENIRLGLEPEQLTPEERTKNAYEPKDKLLEKWFEKTGGVDGQPLGLELDALPISRMRGMFAEGIERWIDLDKRRDDLHNAFVDLIACELLLPAFEAQRQRLCTGIKNSELWQDIASAPLPDWIFRQAATDGWDRIDPTTTTVGGRRLFDCDEDVRAAMREALDSSA